MKLLANLHYKSIIVRLSLFKIKVNIHKDKVESSQNMKLVYQVLPMMC